MSSGLRMPNTRNTKTAIKNRTDGLTLLLYKATISKTTVANTIKDDILMVILFLHVTHLNYEQTLYQLQTKDIW